MEDAGLPQVYEPLSIPEQLSEFSTAPVEDIPEAVREVADLKTKSLVSLGSRKVVLWGIGGVGAIALLSIPLVFFLQTRLSGTSAQVPQPRAESRDDSETSALDRESQPETSPSDTDTPSPSDDTLLGHLPYEEAPSDELVAVSGDGSISLRKTAADQFLAMVDAAKADGVLIVPLSGFRTVAEQEQVFFEVKAERGEAPSQRAEVSAPPGYSEHHTGYAIDVGDGYYPDTDLQPSFERTHAFEWLQQNAAYYSFEPSFPKNNSQGVSYEPWHWRFVGDRDSLETFYRAHNLSRPAQTSEEQR